MSNQIEKAPTFEERVREKLRKDIGELITQEELDKIIKASMEELFFQPIPNPQWETMTYYQRQGNEALKTFPCLAHKLTMELLQPMIKLALNEWIVKNEVLMKRMVQDVFERSLVESIMRGFVTVCQDISGPALSRLEEKIRELHRG